MNRPRRAAGLSAAILLGLSAAGLTAPTLLPASPARAQAPYAGDGGAAPPTAPAAGLYSANCSFCHGAQGQGGQGTALTSSPFFTADDGGRSLHAFLQVGRPSAGMVPFPGLSAEQVAGIHEFIREQASHGPTRAAMDPASILVGDPAAGKAFFEGEGGCTRCHSVAGDLKGVGARYDPMILQGRVLNPRVVGLGRNGPARTTQPAQATVTMPNGQLVSGRIVQINDFAVTLIDGAGVRRTIQRDNETPKVEVNDPAEAHRQMLLTWTDRNMHNVTAYLASLK